MKRLALLLTALAWTAPAAPLPHRWFYLSRNFGAAKDVDEFGTLCQTAAKHGYTGVMLAGPFDTLDRQSEAVRDRLRQARDIAAEAGIEIVPLFLSPGYGGGLLAHDRNLAEGLPVRRALFIAHAGKAQLAPDPPVAVINSGFEEHEGAVALGYKFQDVPGQSTTVDTAVAHTGTASLRFEGFTSGRKMARVMQEVAVNPYRAYRVTAWVKTEEFLPADGVTLQVLATDGRTLLPYNPKLPSNSDWRKVSFAFNSMEYTRIRLYAGTWSGRSGRFWIDDLQVEELGFTNLLRRPGAPLRVESEAGGTVYEEGKDFAPVADSQLNYRADHDGPELTLTSGSRITEGERLRVSWYHALSLNGGQVAVCMSEPLVLAIASANAALIQSILAPRRWVLSIDEIRSGGSDDSCKRRGITMGAILGDFVTRAVNMIHGLNPKAEVWAWSDMLDPNHNAHGNYYLVDGDYTASWEHIPHDLGIVCWYYEKRNASLAFFSGLGFSTIGGAYYDADDLTNPKGWLESLRATPHSTGIIYTTWQNKYALLGDFGDLVSHP